MDFSVAGIKGIAQNLCVINEKSGIFYFELDKKVDAHWENLFSGYISAYKPAIFSLFSPAIIEGRFIRVHADLEGVMGIESVLLHLQAMISYVNSHWRRISSHPKTTDCLPDSESEDLSLRLASLKF